MGTMSPISQVGSFEPDPLECAWEPVAVPVPGDDRFIVPTRATGVTGAIMNNFCGRRILVSGSALLALTLAATPGLAAEGWRSQSLRDQTVTGPTAA